MPSNRNVIVNRTQRAAEKLLDALEECRGTHAEFISLGGNVWTDPFYHEGEDTGNALREDLNHVKQDLINGQIAFDAIGNGQNVIQPAAYFAFLSKLRTG